MSNSFNFDDNRDDLEEGEIEDAEDIHDNGLQMSKNDGKKKDHKRKRRYHRRIDEEDRVQHRTKSRRHHKRERTSAAYRDLDSMNSNVFLNCHETTSETSSLTPFDLLLKDALASEGSKQEITVVDNRGSTDRIESPTTRKRGKERNSINRRNKKRKKEPSPVTRTAVCKFFLDGKCHKKDNCGYLHEGPVQRKLELCKFYLQDCCAKRDKCLYMHSDFPCKFFHTGSKCFSDDKCKFSHAPLNDTTRGILLRHLESAQKETADEEVRSKSSDPSKIPSLFELEIRPPPGLGFSDESGDSPRLQIREEQELCIDAPLNFYRELDEINDGNKNEEINSKSSATPSEFIENDSDVRKAGDQITAPSHLPPRQRELFMRIQQRQQNMQSNQENVTSSSVPADDENWYSSEEEEQDKGTGNNLLKNVLRKLENSQKSCDEQNLTVLEALPANSKEVSSMKFDFTKINLPSNIAKVLSSIHSTSPEETAKNTNESPPSEKRDPRLKQDVDLRQFRLDADLRPRDTDLRNLFGDTDLRNLPPVDTDLRADNLLGLRIPDHAPCKEINASVLTHSPVRYRLVPIAHKTHPDYSDVRFDPTDQSAQSDPRLRKYFSNRMIKDVESSDSLLPVPRLNPNDPRVARLLEQNDSRGTTNSVREEAPRTNSDPRLRNIERNDGLFEKPSLLPLPGQGTGLLPLPQGLAPIDLRAARPPLLSTPFFPAQDNYFRSNMEAGRQYSVNDEWGRNGSRRRNNWNGGRGGKRQQRSRKDNEVYRVNDSAAFPFV